MQKLNKTKKKINFLLTLIIFLLFLSIGIGFFLFRFFYNQNSQIQELKEIKKISKKENNKILNIIDLEKHYFEKLNKINNTLDIKEENISKNVDKFLNQFEKKVFLEIEKIEKKQDIFYEFPEKIKEKYKIFQEKYIIFDTFDGKILFTNISNLEKFNFKKIKGINSEIEKMDIFFVFQLKILGEENIPKYQILFLEKQKYLEKDLKKDIFLYFIFSIFFGIIIYFLGKKLLNYIFKPVEKNLVEMENFTHNAGHELKNPLAGIKSSVELLKEFGEYKPKLVNGTLEEIKKLDSLINTLKDFSFLENKQDLEEIDISVEIKNIINKYHKQIKEKKISIKFEKKNNFKLKAPKNHFHILFSNLFSNAIKYSKENPKIEIIVDKNFIIINDNGVGIKKENFKKIFQKFYRENLHRDNNGFGLGLSLVQKIIEINSWEIEIKSEVGKGTKIKVKF